MLVMLGVRFLLMLVWVSHCDDGLFLSPGSLVDGCCSAAEGCSGKLLKGSRGTLVVPFWLDGLASLEAEPNVGRLEIGRGLGRDFAVLEVVLVLETAGLLCGMAGRAAFFEPKLELAFNRSREAAGRKRMLRPSAKPPPFPNRLSFDCVVRSAGVLGVGKRDIGLGRPLDLPGGI